MHVLYTDPGWALGDAGAPSLERASIEMAAFAPDITLGIGPHDGDRYVTAGPVFLEALAGADAVVIYRAQVSAEAAAVLRDRCLVVARQGVGVDNLNAAALRDAGIWAFNVPDYCVDETSTHALALMLGWERRIVQQDRRIKSGAWGIHDDGLPRRLSERTLGLVGLGRIGRAVAIKARPFFARVVAHDPNVHPDDMAALGVQAMSWEDLLAASDVLSVHAWLDPASNAMIDRTALGMLRPGALLVNTARGQIVHSGAVLEALQSGRLAGFCSDVFSPERPGDDAVNAELVLRDDVVATCHRGFLSDRAERSVRERTAAEVARILRTHTPPRSSRQA